jgi:photosystem II stability/assembly factor-like uncharacterized protein
VYKSTNGGAYWTPLVIPNAVNCALGIFEQTLPLSVAVDPQSPNVLFAGTQLDSVLYWSTDGGASWDIRHCFPGGGDILRVYVDPTDSYRVFAAALGFFRSTDRGVSWEAMNNGIADVSGGLEFLPTNNASLFFAFAAGCVYRTEDQGLHWNLVKCDPIVQSDAALDEPGRHLYASNAGGVYSMRICTETTTRRSEESTIEH